jgi:integrase
MSGDLDRRDAAPAALPPSADDALTPAAAERVADGWALHTRRAFAEDWGRFAAWCEAHGRRALPATGATLASYVTHLLEAGPAPATVSRAIGTIQAHHKAVDLAAPTTAARLALRSYRREWAAGGGRVRRAAAVSAEDLAAMAAAAPEGLPGLRDRVVVTLGFAMMARRSELSGLDIGDLRETSEGLEVFVATSKTDKDSTGATVMVPYGTHSMTCPVRTVRAYLAALAEAGVTSGPLLRGVDRRGRIAGTPGTTIPGSGRLSGHAVNAIVQRLAAGAGLEGVSAHSLRAGAATAAARGGAQRADIARQGRWQPTSTAVDSYIRPADAWKDNPIRKTGI